MPRFFKNKVENVTRGHGQWNLYMKTKAKTNALIKIGIDICFCYFIQKQQNKKR